MWTFVSRRVDDESIPLALDVIVRRLLRDVETVELELPGDLLLPLEHHQRNLEVKRRMLEEESVSSLLRRLSELLWKNTHLQTVVADQAEQRDDGVEHGQEAQSRQHVAGALLQDELVHVEERVLVVLLIAAPAVLTVFLFVTLAGDLNSTGIWRFIRQDSVLARFQDCHFIIYLQMHFQNASRALQTAACLNTAASMSK